MSEHISGSTFTAADDEPILVAVTNVSAILHHVLQYEYAALSPCLRCYGRALSHVFLCWLPEAQLTTWESLRAQGTSIPAILSLHPDLLHIAAQTLASHLPGVAQPAPSPSLLDPTCCQPLWTCTLQNTSGTHAKAASIHAVAQETSATLFFGTETKLTPACHRSAWLKGILPDYHVFYSSFPTRNTGQAGTFWAQHKALTGRCLVEICPTPKLLQGYLTHARLTVPHGTPRHCITIYQTPLPHKRFPAAAAISAYVQDLRSKFPADRFLIGGDFNAVLNPSLDRSPGSAKAYDRTLPDLLAACNLTDVFSKCPGRPPHTFARGTSSARLDYFLCGTDDPLLDALASTPQPFVHTTLAARHSDHLPVTFTVPHSALFDAPLPPPPGPTPSGNCLHSPARFLRPFSSQALTAFKHQVTAKLGDRAHVISQRILNALPHPSSRPLWAMPYKMKPSLASLLLATKPGPASLPNNPAACPQTPPPKQAGS